MRDLECGDRVWVDHDDRVGWGEICAVLYEDEFDIDILGYAVAYNEEKFWCYKEDIVSARN